MKRPTTTLFPKDVYIEIVKEQKMILKETGIKVPLSEIARKMLQEYKQAKYRKQENGREYFPI